MRPVVDYRSDSRAAYELFCEKSKVKIPFKVWKAVILQFNEKFVDYILTSGDVVELPHGLGTTFVEKRKSTVRTRVINGVEIRIGPIDWVATNATGSLVYHKNYHTDGYTARLKWLPMSAKFQHKDCFALRYAKGVKRKFGILLKSDKGAMFMDRYREKI